MTTYHWIYPHDSRRIAAPWSIGNHVADYLRGLGHSVHQYDWREHGSIRPLPGEVLIGHPCQEPGTVFLESVAHPGWARKVAVCPFNGYPPLIAWTDTWLPLVDAYAAICGPYWAERIPDYWRHKTTPLDMAIDVSRFPMRRGHVWGKPGERSILYYGCTVLPFKGTDYLEQIVAAAPSSWRWLHSGPGEVRGCRELGYIDPVNPPAAMMDADLAIFPGRWDANPTALLECAAWGIPTISTETSGWQSPVTSPSLQLDNVRETIQKLGIWQRAWPAAMDVMAISRRYLALGYTFSKFCATLATMAC